MENIKIEIKSEFIENVPSEIEKIKQKQPEATFHNTNFKQEQPVKCEICGKGFKCEDLEIHMTLHAGTANTNGNLIRKRKIEVKVIPEESVKCQYCGKGFKKEDLIIHESTHIRSVKSIKCTVCSICNKWFDLKDAESHLQSHIRSRAQAVTVTKLEQCKDCGKRHLNGCTMSSKMNKEVEKSKKKKKKILQQEMIIISDNKTILKIEEDRIINQPENVPVICKYCGKGFKSNDLKLHESLHEMALHKEKKPMAFGCDLCYKSFESNIQLNSHKIKYPKHGGGHYFGCNLND